MHGLDVRGRVEDRGQSPEVLLDLGALAADVDQLGAVGAVEDHALVGRDQAHDPRVAVRGYRRSSAAADAPTEVNGVLTLFSPCVSLPRSRSDRDSLDGGPQSRHSHSA